ncbi:MAG: hypothetical protein IPM24_03740 [Bryobacterales bacterium]|nr:hypothetical protein [Bryobacterales bacterium]
MAAILAAPLAGDTLELRDGKTVQGTYLGGSSRQIRMEVGDRIQTFSISDVKSLRFGADEPAPVPQPRAILRPAAESPIMRPAPEAAVAPKAAEPTGTVIPEGTQVTVRMIEAIDSEVNSIGQTFRASLDEPVMVNGRAVVPRGTDVVIKLVEDRESGRIQGRAELGTILHSIRIDGRDIDLTSEQVTTQSESRTGRSGTMIGGGAAVGAALGAIFGGGKGAAIGAISGAGAGTAVQVMTKGQRVRIPSETRLTYALQYPVRL